jgi:hypothetical protein
MRVVFISKSDIHITHPRLSTITRRNPNAQGVPSHAVCTSTILTRRQRGLTVAVTPGKRWCQKPSELNRSIYPLRESFATCGHSAHRKPASREPGSILFSQCPWHWGGLGYIYVKVVSARSLGTLSPGKDQSCLCVSLLNIALIGRQIAVLWLKDRAGS